MDDRTMVVSAKIQGELADKFKTIMSERSMTPSEVVREGLRVYLEVGKQEKETVEV